MVYRYAAKVPPVKHPVAEACDCCIAAKANAMISKQKGGVIVPRIPKRFSALLARILANTLGGALLASVLPLGCLAGSVMPGAAMAAEDDSGTPYWASLRTQPANLRVGPGREYRISWVYVREGVPLKVLRVIGGWRLVEDIDGARGWMLAQFLARARTATVKGSIAEIREKADGASRLLWRAGPGVTGKLGDCGPVWCKIDLDGRQGHVAKAAVWGAD